MQQHLNLQSTAEFSQTSDGLFHSTVLGMGQGIGIAMRFEAPPLEATSRFESPTTVGFVDAILTKTTIYADAPSLQVAIYGLHVPQGSTQVTFQVSGDQLSPPLTIAADCVVWAVGATRPLCIATGHLPASLFISTSALESMATYEVHLEHASQSLSVGMVRIHQRPTFPTGQYVFTLLPTDPVKVGDVVSFEIFARFGTWLQTFIVELQTSASLQVLSVDVASTGWSGTTATVGDRAVLSYLRQHVPSSNITAPELLATVIINVSGVGDGGITVACSDTTDMQGRALTPTVSGLSLGRVLSQNGHGTIEIGLDEDVGLLVGVPSSTVVNTALLDGQDISFPAEIFGIRASGHVLYSTAAANENLRCFTDHIAASVVECSTIVMSGAFPPGDHTFELTVIHEALGLVRRVRFTVLSPVLPVQLVLQRATLHRIGVAGCTDTRGARIQDTGVRALTDFYGPDGVQLQDIDVTPHIMTILESTNETVGALDRSARLVHGLNAGSTLLQALHPFTRAVVGVTRVTVDMIRPKNVTRINAQASKSIIVRGISHRANDGAVSIVADLDGSALTGAHEEMRVLAEAIFEDGTRMRLGPAVGLQVSCADYCDGMLNQVSPTAFALSSAVAPGTTAAPEILVEWASTSVCGSQAAIASQRIEVPIAMAVPPPPVLALSASLAFIAADNSAPRAATLVPAGDVVGSSLGLPTWLELRVSLVYPEHAVDATLDDRTVFSIVNHGTGRISLRQEWTDSTRQQQRLVVRSDDGVPTWVDLTVSFPHEHVNATVTLKVVVASGLAVSAAPVLDGCELTGPPLPTNASLTLSTIRGTSPMLSEAVELSLHARMSDGSELPVRHDGFVSVRNVASDATVTPPRVSSGSVFHPASHTGEFLAYAAVGELHGLVSEAILIVVSDQQASIVEIEHLSYTAADETRLDGSVAFCGAKNASFASPTVVMGLSNGRLYSVQLDLPSATPLKELFRFSSSSPSAIMLDELGTATLLENSLSLVTVSVEATDPTGMILEATTFFATNLDAATAGDVDFGESGSFAIPPQTAGQIFELPVRINSGARNIGAFDFTITFDATVIAIQNPEDDFWLHGAVKSSMLVTMLGFGELRVAGILDGHRASPGPSPELLGHVRFRALANGFSPLGGTVHLLVDDSFPGVNIGTREMAIVAGRSVVAVSASRLDRRQDTDPPTTTSALHTATPRPGVGPVAAAAGSSACRGTPAVQGDANADCILDINDIRFLIGYIAYRRLNFAGHVGQQVLTIAQRSSDFGSVVDADLNGAIEMRDAALLNRINMGLAFFEQLPRVHADSLSPHCGLSFEVDLRSAHAPMSQHLPQLKLYLLIDFRFVVPSVEGAEVSLHPESTDWTLIDLRPASRASGVGGDAKARTFAATFPNATGASQARFTVVQVVSTTPRLTPQVTVLHRASTTAVTTALPALPAGSSIQWDAFGHTVDLGIISTPEYGVADFVSADSADCLQEDAGLQETTASPLQVTNPGTTRGLHLSILPTFPLGSSLLMYITTSSDDNWLGEGSITDTQIGDAVQRACTDLQAFSIDASGFSVTSWYGSPQLYVSVSGDPSQIEMLRTAVRSGRFFLTLDGGDYAVRIFSRLTTAAPAETLGVSQGDEHRPNKGTQSRYLYYALVSFAAVLVIVSAILVTLRRKQITNGMLSNVHYDAPSSTLSVGNRSQLQLGSETAAPMQSEQPAAVGNSGSSITIASHRGSLASFGVESPVIFATNIVGAAGSAYPSSPGASHTADTVVNDAFQASYQPLTPAPDAAVKEWDAAFHKSSEIEAEMHVFGGSRMASDAESTDTFRDGDYVEITDVLALEDSDEDLAYLDVSGFPENHNQSDQLPRTSA